MPDIQEYIPGLKGNAITIDASHIIGTLTIPVSSTLVSKTANYIIVSTDGIILANATSAGFTVTLPTAIGVTGIEYTIKKTDSSINLVTIATTSSQTIDGITTKTLGTQYASITVISDGANWQII